MVSEEVTEIMEICSASKLVKQSTSVPYWTGCKRAGKLKVVMSHFSF